MFDLDAGKLIIVGIAALVFIPSKDLPRVLRQAGQMVGKMKRMASEFQGQFMDAMREADMADLRQEAQKLADSARIDTGLHSMADIARPLPRKPLDQTFGDPRGVAPEGGLPDPNAELRRLATTPEAHGAPPAEPSPLAPHAETPPPRIESGISPETHG